MKLKHISYISLIQIYSNLTNFSWAQLDQLSLGLKIKNVREFMKQPNPNQQTLNRISISYKNYLSQFSIATCLSKLNDKLDCPKLYNESKFTKFQFYRPISGQCSSLYNFDESAGAADTALERWLPAKYDSNKMPLTYSLPNAREISNSLKANQNLKGLFKKCETMTVVTSYGQYLSHDLAFTPDMPSNCDKACFSDSYQNLQQGCSPIWNCDISSGCSCIPMKRSATICSKTHVLNEATSFIDGSPVYGSNKERLLEIRSGAFLKTNHLKTDAKNRHFLPVMDDQREICVGHLKCFLAGDKRASEAPLLTTFHTLFLREHNRIASIIKKYKKWQPDFNDNQIFHETRKIIAGMHQKIAFLEYLPKILGRETVLQILNDQRRDQTNSPSSPAISVVFTHAAFRFAHLNLNPFVAFAAPGLDLSNKGSRSKPKTFIKNLPIHKLFFRPDKFIQYGLDGIINGGMLQNLKLATNDNFMASSFTERLFSERLENVTADLFTLDIARGRDVGLQPYNAWREFCHLKKLSWKSLATGNFWRTTFSQLVHLKALYKNNFENLDLFVGANLEKPVYRGSLLGPTWHCLIEKQFSLLKKGDRYFYLNDEKLKVMLNSKVSLLAHLICKNSNLEKVRADPFLAESGIVYCDEIGDFDFDGYFKDS